MNRYNTKKKEKYYREVAEMHFGRGMGVAAIAKAVPISSKTISRWISIFAAENNISHTMAKNEQETDNPQVDTAHSDDVKALKAEIKRLKAELRMHKIRGDLYDEIINVAERNMGIQIRKKAGTKQ